MVGITLSSSTFSRASVVVKLRFCKTVAMSGPLFLRTPPFGTGVSGIFGVGIVTSSSLSFMTVVVPIVSGIPSISAASAIPRRSMLVRRPVVSFMFDVIVCIVHSVKSFR